jgi:hypothetical protein
METTFKALDATKLKTALAASTPTGITLSTTTEPKVDTTKGEAEILANFDKATHGEKAKKWACDSCGITDIAACDATISDGRRLSAERRLPAADHKVTVKMVSKEAFVTKSGSSAAAVTTSGASVFGIAVAIGLVALY